MVAVVFGPLLRPDLLHCFDAFAEDTAKRLAEGRSVVLDLGLVPAAPDSEEEATVRELVEARHLLGGLKDVALCDQADPGCDEQSLGRLGRHGECHEGIGGLVVRGRQAGFTWRWRARGGRRHGNVRMLGEPHGFEAALLGGPAQIAWMDRLGRGEEGQTELHVATPEL